MVKKSILPLLQYNQLYYKTFGIKAWLSLVHSPFAARTISSHWKQTTKVFFLKKRGFAGGLRQVWALYDNSELNTSGQVVHIDVSPL